jgi:phosphoglycolate phosphatase-like HAD superfamily hydrolase
MTDLKKQLQQLVPDQGYFVGIDSDGCVFDSMDVKHREFFIPNVIKHYGLYPVAGAVRETWEFVNLHSVWRGTNRFPALVKVFDLLRKRKEITAKGITVPQLSDLSSWITNTSGLSSSNLKTYLASHPSAELEKVFIWSEAVNYDISQWLTALPPFRHAPAAIEKLHIIADIIVVSQTPQAALEKEWTEEGLIKYVRAIAGQEYGTKSEHLSLAAQGKYPTDRILMIGDAPGDLKAARENGVLFFPVIPGREDECWKELLSEGISRFTEKKFSGKYQQELIDLFSSSLPEKPTWE